MSRKQNSLMRFSRTERLAQLSEQESVIERKKREIQAKIEAQRKKQSEESRRRLETTNECKVNKSGLTENLSQWRDDSFEKDNRKWKADDKSGSMKNAFSNDGSFLDQFKKLSKNHLDPVPTSFTKMEESSNEHSMRKLLNSHIQIQLPPPGVIELRSQDHVILPSQSLSSDSHENNSAQNFSSPISYSNISENPSKSGSFSSLTSKIEKVPKAFTETISMTFKNNKIKKLELLSNPFSDDDDEDNDDGNDNDNHKDINNSSNELKKNCQGKNFKFITEEGLVESTKYKTTAVAIEKDSSRISSAFCNNNMESQEGADNPKVDYQHLAKMVAKHGNSFMDNLRKENINNPAFGFLFDKNSKEYASFHQLVSKFRNEEEKEGMQKYSPDEKQIDCANKWDKQNSKDRDHHSSLSLSKIRNEKSEKIQNCDGYQADSEEDSFIVDRQKNSKPYVEHAMEPLDSKKASEMQAATTTSENLQPKDKQKRKRKSRWGEAVPSTNNQPPPLINNSSLPTLGKVPPPKTNLLSQLTRSDPGLIQYAKQTFGSTNLSEEDWKKAEDHYKINLLYQDLVKKRAALNKLERAGKFKYEYDSDEDVEGGTWEHKLRQQEMMATQLWAEELTRQAAGKHHIGDFLPPEELERFMEKYNAVKEGREPDLSDYKEFKLKEDNVGYRLLQKMGWNEGQGLGQDGTGITNPVNKATTRHENQGLGVERPDGLEPGDDEYDAYRKRMMLAYRFRPNPLNNPRRPYY